MEIQLSLVGSVVHTVTTKVLATSALGQLKLLHGQQHISAVGRVVNVGLELVQRWQPLTSKPKIARQVDFLKSINILLRVNLKRQPNIIDIKAARDRVRVRSPAHHHRKHQHSGNNELSSVHVVFRVKSEY